MSRLVGKPTMWFPNNSDTNQPVQSQKRARSLKGGVTDVPTHGFSLNFTHE